MPDLNIIDFSELGWLHHQDSCITIGNFDGVHRGHQAILGEITRRGESLKLPVIVVTFFPNPADFFAGHERGFYLSTPEEKEALLCAMGVEAVITLRFDRDLASLTARDFLSMLKTKLGFKLLVVGHDFTLGRDRQGRTSEIKSLGEELSFEVDVVQPVLLGDDEISSTAIRRYLNEGKVDAAAELLGRSYSVSGEVIHGSDRGSGMGLPTANISPWALKKLPGVGVYASYVLVDGETYQGITNIGYRPTFEDQSQPNMETHILGFDGNIYGKEITLEFIKKIRDERKFSGADAFLAQIELDKTNAHRIFNYDQTQAHLSSQSKRTQP
jgi:riboflavin kinase/FMN adenylyltransferase